MKSVTKLQLKVRRSSAGLGLFAAQPIRKGRWIIEYVGPLLNLEQTNKKGGKYLFAIDKKWTIDGSSRRNTARYINHSCVPNCEPWIIGRKVKIKARRNIAAGEELTYNYGKEYFDDFIGTHCRCPKHTKQ